jgi:hypothetical protein
MYDLIRHLDTRVGRKKIKQSDEQHSAATDLYQHKTKTSSNEFFFPNKILSRRCAGVILMMMNRKK